MARSPKPAASPAKNSSDSDSADVRTRLALHALMFVIFASATVAIFRVCELYVDRCLAYPTEPPRIVLADRPAWMTDYLAEEIIKTAEPMGLHSALDHALLIEVVRSLQSNPWIKKVNFVRRVYDQKPGDTLEIDCEYRAPAALVKWGQYYWLVDCDGVKLPEQYTASELPRIMLSPDKRINVRIIDGVLHPPTESGKVWPGDDLAGGLEMARLLGGNDWSEQIRDIDVRNFDGRRDPSAAQIVLFTRFGTQVRWGRPPGAKDAFVEAPATSKLAALQSIYNQDKRIDANQPWIDVRFDRVTCPIPDRGAPAGVAAGDSETR
jgi:hypothetical protein